MADLMHTHRTGYSKMKNNQQDIPVDKLVFVAKNFGISVDDIIFFNEKNNVPNEVSMENTDVVGIINTRTIVTYFFVVFFEYHYLINQK